MRREINSEELGFFYRATGEAIWQLQYVEDSLCKFYIVICIHFGCDGITRENAEMIQKKISRKTWASLSVCWSELSASKAQCSQISKNSTR